MANDVTFQREEYTRNLPRWQLVNDCCDGQDAVKARKETYLPIPNPKDKGTEADERYASYLKRAVFYNITGKTLDGVTGLAFKDDPEIDLHEGLAFLHDDVDGKGLTLIQHAQQTFEAVFRTGFYGLLADYPKSKKGLSLADKEALNIRATVAAYPARSIINWRVSKVGAAHKLSLVTLAEKDAEVTADGFGVEEKEQYRVLKLVDGVYWVEIWKQKQDANTKKVEWYIDDTFTPLKSDGSVWREIPFSFVGSKNNDAMPDKAPLLDIANVNIGQYRNSADYEEGIFMHGQGTLFVDIGNFSDDDFKKANPNGILLGARAGNVLGQGGNAYLLQMSANTPALEAMKQKSADMVALGAQLITDNGQIKTATEASGDIAKSTSVLSLVCSNVSAAYTKALGYAAQFEGIKELPYFHIQNDFRTYELDPQLITALVQLWQTGTYPRSDYLTQLRKYGLVDAGKTDEEVQEEVDSQGDGLGLDDDSDSPAS